MRSFHLIILFIFIAINISVSPVCSQENILSSFKQDNEKLHISSDKLVSDTNANYILFSGNVTTTRGKYLITSDYVKILLSSESTDIDELSQDRINTIVANGNVTVQLDNKFAKCDKAVYNTETETIVLTGNDTRIYNESNYITGERITVHLDSEQIVIDGAPDKRVNAVFQPNQN